MELFKAEIVTTTSPSEKKARQLFKDATAASGEDSDKVVALFLQARDQATLSGVDFGIDVYLRLPRYFQEAGKPDEGWREFNNLLTGGYPNMMEGDRAWYGIKSQVYDKMRLFLQREKRLSQAITFGALSIIWDIKATLTEWPEREMHKDTKEKYILAEQEQRRRWRENDIEQARSLCAPERLSKQLTKLLRRAKLLDRHDDALAVLHEWANAQPDVNDFEYEKQFNTTLG